MEGGRDRRRIRGGCLGSEGGLRCGIFTPRACAAGVK